MKFILTLLFVVFISAIAFAQTDNKTLLLTPSAFTPVNNVKNKDTAIRTCTCSTGSSIASPLIVIFSHDKLIYKSAGSSDILSKISPQSIKSINVLKDSSSVAKYGDLAKNGVIEIYLDDKNYPDAYKIFKPDSAGNKKKQAIIPVDDSLTNNYYCLGLALKKKNVWLV